MSPTSREGVRDGGPRLAQVNVSRPRAALDSPLMGGFLAAIEPVNRLADTSPGFVWRLRSSESHGAVLVSQDGQPLMVNLSVWESYEALHAFVYRTMHGGFIRRRSRWFDPIPPPATALWWVEAGQQPTLEDALRRLQYLRAHGPTPQAFTVRRRFRPDGRGIERGQLRATVR